MVFNMIKINEIIIVEGKYDKIKLESIIDGVIIPTDGFSIFKDKEKIDMLRVLAKKKGILILTDSDMAGFKIRGYINSCISEGSVKNAFIPDILGKERRKQTASKEGKLGVEGIAKEILITCLKNAGIRLDDIEKKAQKPIKKMHLYEDGIVGRENSVELRKKLLLHLNLPQRISSNSLLDIINSLYSYDEYKKIIDELNMQM